MNAGRCTVIKIPFSKDTPHLNFFRNKVLNLNQNESLNNYIWDAEALHPVWFWHQQVDISWKQDISVSKHLENSINLTCFYISSYNIPDLWSKQYALKKWFCSDAHSEPSQRSKMELFAKMNNGSQPLTIFGKSSTLDVWLDCE